MIDIVRKTEDIYSCQIFSPPEMVETLLDSVGYTHRLHGKKILENSFGDGNILSGIIKRYISDCKKQNLSLEEIKQGLNSDIHGFEIYPEHYDNCIKRLNKIAFAEGITDIHWSNLKLDNFLESKELISYDFIIANPPYIDYRKLSNSTREKLKEQFHACKNGKFDYCYPFIEQSINHLAETGKLSMLLPVNVYKNLFGKNIRRIMHRGVEKIILYPQQNKFKKKLTSSSIFVFNNTPLSNQVIIENNTSKFIFSIDRESLDDSKWVFAKKEESVTHEKKFIRFGDIFHASMVVATLYNEAFIITADTIENEKLEPAVIRPAASPRGFATKKKEFIIFPYKYDKENNLIRYNEEYFSSMFPNVENHLKQFSTNLNKRNSDNNIAWFEYGRSQALRILNQNKLLVSTVITNKVYVYELDSQTIPYSGIIITTKAKQYDLSFAKEILSSREFKNYVDEVGVTVNNESIRISSRDINNFIFPI